MKKFMSTYDLMEDEKYKLMCDDIVISMRTIGTVYGKMFISARQNSNGRETSYNVNELPEVYKTPNPFSKKLQRANAFNWTQDIDLEEYDDDDDHSQLHNISRVPLNRSQTSGTCVKLMRAASSGVESTQQYFEDYDHDANDHDAIDRDAIEKEVQDQFKLDHPHIPILPLTRQNAWIDNSNMDRKDSASGNSEASV